ncbi:mitochondrial ribosome assembly protein RRG9 [Aspergillus ibericus CBS 121593]|uniref:Required for respiratory growth protein 9, mitochondrial n=1 Tax=Aspergillus ibericus CBS 121593 TaxID=1448316 RepID=A0A395GQK6_9EURO|nr:hypothetical protein BO80DRAFT_195673 [Aspergillus ibericus CBS 121593]RAK97228.1 hypothetical protein BO80DRAFT_195673 [Aspergillus ibericus CBS 121593]
MANVCTSSFRLSLPNVLRNALRSEFALDVHQSPAYRRLSVTPLSHRRIPKRNFGSSPKSQLYPSPNRLSPQEPPSTSAGIPTDGLGKAPRGKRSTEDALTEANAASDPADINFRPEDYPADTHALKKSKTKYSRSKKGPRDEQSSSSTAPAPAPAPQKKKKKLEKWEIQKKALQGKFKEGWNPPKKLSPDAIEGIRHLHAVAPERFTTPVLAEEFKVSPEAIRRILKSKWRPSEAELDDRRKRWEKRHDRIWGHMSELGLRPSTKRTRELVDANQLLYGDKKKGPRE